MNIRNAFFALTVLGALSLTACKTTEKTMQAPAPTPDPTAGSMSAPPTDSMSTPPADASAPEPATPPETTTPPAKP